MKSFPQRSVNQVKGDTPLRTCTHAVVTCKHGLISGIAPEHVTLLNPHERHEKQESLYRCSHTHSCAHDREGDTAARRNDSATNHRTFSAICPVPIPEPRTPNVGCTARLERGNVAHAKQEWDAALLDFSAAILLQHNYLMGESGVGQVCPRDRGQGGKGQVHGAHGGCTKQAISGLG